MGVMESKIEQELALPVGVTLDRFIMHSQSAFPYATGELSQLLRDIALAGKIINREVNKAGLIDVTGANGTENVQGENQQKLDIIANIRFIRALKNGGEVCAILSEEDEDIIHTGNDHGKYVVAMDPLDGSSNIDVNVSIGTIFQSTDASHRSIHLLQLMIFYKADESRLLPGIFYMVHPPCWFIRPAMV